MAAAETKKYEDFDPLTEIAPEKDCDTILVYVPGFKKEKLRVQLTTTNLVRITGEKEVDDTKLIRFQKQLPITPNTDTNRISAKFENGILYVKLPKLIIPEDKPDNNLPVPQPPKPEAPADKPQPRTTNVQQQTRERRTSTQSDGSKKQAAVQDVPQKTVEKDETKMNTEKSTKAVDSGSHGQKPEERKREENATRAGEGRGKSKTKPENYQGTAVDPASKLKMSRRAFYVVLVTLAAVGVGLYVTNVIRSFRTSEISD